MIYLSTIMIIVYLVSVSCTRNKSLKWGAIRIVLDGDKISERFVIKSVLYFTQSEERIFTNDEIFPIFDYIICIDILEYLVGDIIELLDNKGISYNLVSKF